MKKQIAAVFDFILLSALCFGQSPLYMDSNQSIERRIEDLLSRMTTEEKIGQINMPCVYESGLGRTDAEKFEGSRRFVMGEQAEGVGPGGGFFTMANTILHQGPRQQAEFFNELQQLAMRTRLKIPLLQTEEGTHGLMCSGGTIFPEGLALGSTWDLPLISEIYKTAAREARAVGIHQLFTLVVEPYRDPRLGRNQEGYSEDPFLTACIAEEIVRAVQGEDLTADDKVVAGLCHYPGQSQPASGLERGAMEISERTLREVFLPPWQAGITKAGALGVMATYPAIDGVPVHASNWILTEILRNELGFEGLVLSEGGGIETIVYEGLAADQKGAGPIALKAGVDVGISYEHGYMLGLNESLEEGLLAERFLNRAVRRVLRQKFRLGLFENYLVDPDKAESVSHTEEHQELALKAAREGIVLLKNDGELLPLSRNLKRIAVIGPNADHERNQLGDYTSSSILQDITTVLEGIKEKLTSETTVEYVRGCDVIDRTWEEIEKAREAAARADIAIVVLGENEWQAADKKGTSGEAFDVASLDLTGLQQDLVKAVHGTGTPTVVVLINGRPLSTRWIAENVPAVVEAWCPGEKGGRAVADVLFGDYNPSGKLPVTIPRHSGQLPVYYNFKKSKDYWIKNGWGVAYADMSSSPLYEFGFGLSYTRFLYRDLKVESKKVQGNGEVKLSVVVENQGDRSGSEVVQVYVNDLQASVSTPIHELKAFRKILLDPGESASLKFTIPTERLKVLNQNLEWVLEPGIFEIQVGSSSKKIHLTERIEVIP